MFQYSSHFLNVSNMTGPVDFNDLVGRNEVPGTKSSTLRSAKFTEGQNLRRGQKV